MLPKPILRCALLFFFSGASLLSFSQAPVTEKLSTLPAKFINDINKRASRLEQQIDKQAEKALLKMRREEQQLKKKLWKRDSVKAKELFGNSEERFNNLEQRLENNQDAGEYVPVMDTLLSSVKFLQQNPQLLTPGNNMQQKLGAALDKLNGLDSRFQQAEEIKQFIKQRRQYLQQQLGQLGFARELKRLSKDAYYFSEQLTEYKAVLEDHNKATAKAIELLSKTRLFKDFMRRHSQLAALFGIPGNFTDEFSQVSLAGLQTRAQVGALVQQQLAMAGANGPQQLQQNIQEAQNQLNQLKDKISQLGRSSSTDELPEGFKPNNQKTKSFLQRLELGINLQSQKPNGYFPVTSDVGLSVGYKLNDKSVIGIGASYKIGWGQNIRNINVSSQGAGIRSFADWKIKKSFWLSGGYEMNYHNEFSRIAMLKDLDAWQQSGLVGVSKIVSLKTKFFKKTKLQLFWDFLSYQQIPKTQPVKFRIGYNF